MANGKEEEPFAAYLLSSDQLIGPHTGLDMDYVVHSEYRVFGAVQ